MVKTLSRSDCPPCRLHAGHAGHAGHADQGASFQRSIDVGASWVRINDDQHQWAGVWAITGAPKTFGTVYLGTNGRGIVYGTSPN